MELYEIAHFYVNNETICDNERGQHDHSLPCLLSPYKLKVYEKPTSLNNRYHTSIDVTTKPEHICMLLSLLFLRLLLRKHDYLIITHHTWCWITSFPFVVRYRKCSSAIQEAHIGGGVSELFSMAQLQPYLLKSKMMLTPSADVM